MSDAITISEINKAIGAHGMYKFKLGRAISRGASELTPDEVRCDDKCEFGKWLHSSSISDRMRTGMPYQVVSRLHADFHKCAGRILEYAVSSRALEASRLMEGEFSERSHILVVALNKWKRELQMDKAA